MPGQWGEAGQLERLYNMLEGVFATWGTVAFDHQRWRKSSRRADLYLFDEIKACKRAQSSAIGAQAVGEPVRACSSVG